MRETPDEELTPLAEAVSDGRRVDWEAETALRPHLGQVVRELRVLEALAAVHRAPESLKEEAAQTGGSEPPAEPRERWGALVLIEKLGGGGFGEVYRAYDPGLQREVALKLVRPDRLRDEGAAERLLDEGRRLARVRHPNVVVVHGVDRHEGTIGTWSDLIRGQTLEALLAQQGPLGAREASHIGMELCRALAAVHAAGLVHRDVKTPNVMREQGGRIVLMDFGAASESADPGETVAQATLLTTAPEVLGGEPASPAADIYGLGVLLYRLTSGRYPIEAASLEELRAGHASGEHVLLRTRRPDLPSDFVRIVETALDADPQRRFASAAAMERALAGQGYGAGGASTHWRRWGWLAAAAVVGALVLGVAVVRRTFEPPRGAPASPGGSDPGRPAAVPPTLAKPQDMAGPQRVVPPLAAAATLHRRRAGEEVTLAPGDGVAPGDALYLELESSEPAYVYVFDEDENGEAFALFPAPELDLQNPLAGGVRHRLPGPRRGEPFDWQVTSVGGSETVVVVASRTQIAALERALREWTAASPDRQVASGRGDASQRDDLRGIGGMQPTAGQADPGAGRLARLLSGAATHAPWVWRIRLENRGR